MVYFHEFAEMQLRYELTMNKFKYPIVSDVKNQNFKVTTEDNNIFIVDVKNLSVEHMGVSAPDKCKDWNIFIKFIIDQLKN